VTFITIFTIQIITTSINKLVYDIYVPTLNIIRINKYQLQVGTYNILIKWKLIRFVSIRCSLSRQILGIYKNLVSVLGCTNAQWYGYNFTRSQRHYIKMNNKWMMTNELCLQWPNIITCEKPLYLYLLVFIFSIQSLKKTHIICCSWCHIDETASKGFFPMHKIWSRSTLTMIWRGGDCPIKPADGSIVLIVITRQNGSDFSAGHPQVSGLKIIRHMN